LADEQRGEGKKPTNWSVARYALGLGVFVTLSIVFGFFAGSGLDALLGSRPWCAIVLMLLAVAGSFYKVYRDVMKMY